MKVTRKGKIARNAGERKGGDDEEKVAIAGSRILAIDCLKVAGLIEAPKQAPIISKV